MSNLRILVSGASIAGPTLAYWLHKAGAQVTVIERAPALRTAGQNIDIRGPGIEVVRRMGLLDAIKENNTTEAGMIFVDEANRTRAEFPVDTSGGTDSFTAELEVLRGVLGRIIYDATKDNVEYIFGDSIRKIDTAVDGAKVEFAKGAPREFDIVVVAEGLNSRTRDLVFGAEESFVKSLGMYASYFTIPKGTNDGKFARWYNAPGGRTILVRPDNYGTTRALLAIMSSSNDLKEASHSSPSAQKKIMRELFADAGWEADRVMEGMDQADDLYMHEIAQIKMERWSRGRVVLLGDSAACPSPISGMGTTVSLVGAYCLAGEIAKQPQDHAAAFDAYEAGVRPLVGRAQKLFPGAPGIANPQTRTGIEILRYLQGVAAWTFGFITRTGLVKFIPGTTSLQKDNSELPEYAF